MNKRMLIAAALIASCSCAWAQEPSAPPTAGATEEGEAPKKAAGPRSPKSLRLPPLRPVQIPEPVSVTLSNGMRVFLLENHELPMVSGRVLVRTGNLFDPNDKRGLADLTGQVMRSGGTKAKTGDELDEALENIAASVESSIGETSGSVSFSCLKENTDTVIGIFKDVLTSPEFRQEKLDLAKIQARSGISRRNDDAGSVAEREFLNTIYGRETPYGWMIEYEHVDRIQRADLVAFYQRYFFPKNMILSVYGDFDANAMKAKLESLLGEWKVEQQPVPKFPEVEQKSRPGIFLAERDDVTQTFFQIGHLGGMYKDKDYAALSVAASILGSGFSSRLMSEVRTKLGYAYSIGAGWGAEYNHPGRFRIVGSTKSASTADTIRVVKEEVDKLRKAGVTREELRVAKDRLLNGFVFNFDSPAKTLNRIMAYEYHGYPRDFIRQYQAGIDSTTIADVKRVADQYFKPEDFTIVAVGNPKEFEKPLDSLGLPVKKLDLAIPGTPQQPAPAPAAAHAPAASQAKAVDPDALSKGMTLLVKMQQALGGAEKLAALRDIEQVRTVEIETGGTTMKAAQKTQMILPNHLRQEQDFAFGKVIVYSDSQSGWMIAPQGERPIQPGVLRQVKSELFRALPSLLLSDRVPGRAINAVDDKTVEISDREGNMAKLVIDPLTGRPARLIYLSTQMNGAASEVAEVYSDWRDSGGAQLPYRLMIEQAGRKIFDATVTECRVNSGLKPDDMAKKPAADAPKPAEDATKKQ